MKKILTLLFSVVLLLFSSCHQDELFNQNEETLTLKSCQVAPGKYEGTYSGGDWRIALPVDKNEWNDKVNRSLVVYAHGMVDPYPWEDVALPADMVDGKLIEDIIVDMGLGYAATSYSDNGLVVLDAVNDVVNLLPVIVDFFSNFAEHGYLPPRYIFLGGPSEGGLVTVKTIETHPHLFHGAISICGPIGDFGKQMKYNGDFHVLFNYFFGSYVNVGNPKDGVPESVMDAWKDPGMTFQNQLIALLSTNLDKVKQLLKCAKVTVDFDSPAAMITATMQCLRFNVMLTNDVKSRVGGIPFDNRRTWYWGSTNDWMLNRKVQRIRATAKVNAYETTGNIQVPLVTIHTTGDHVTPFWHHPAYRLKIFLKGKSLLHTGMPVVNYGHCTVTEAHLIAALGILITKVTVMDALAVKSAAFSNQESQQTFKQIMDENSIEVEIK